jgi:hypothetical protein
MEWWREVMGHVRGRPALAALATVLIVVLVAAPSPAQEAARSASFLRVQWHVTTLSRPTHIRLEGYVYNDSQVRVTDVRLHVVERDRAARAVGEAWGWVFGDVPAGGSVYFAIPLETVADAYDVVVVSFDAVANEAP